MASSGLNSFAQRIALLQQGEHLCSVYSSTGEMLSQVVPYIKAGLLNNERCIYVADECTKDTIIDALRFWGLGPEMYVTKGQLVFWTRHEYRQPGIFQLDVMLDFVRRTLAQAVVDGHTGIRLAVEMSWSIQNGITDDDLIRWEDFINTISFAGSQASFLCQYNSRLHASSLIGKAVRVHPVVILGHDVCPNRYCRPAADVLRDHMSEPLETILRKIIPPDPQPPSAGIS